MELAEGGVVAGKGIVMIEELAPPPHKRLNSFQWFCYVQKRP